MSGLGNDKANSLTNLMYNLQNANVRTRSRIAQRLRQQCEIESREMSSDRFTRFLEKVVRQVGEMGDSQTTKESKLGCISAVDELIEVSCRDAEKTHFWMLHKYVRNLLWNSSDSADIDVLQPAARALGHLARSGGGNAARIVDVEVKGALESITFATTGDHPMRRLVAVLVRCCVVFLKSLFSFHLQFLSLLLSSFVFLIVLNIYQSFSFWFDRVVVVASATHAHWFFIIILMS